MNSIEAKVSIIIPVYNNEQYLEQCLSSIRKQKYQNLEIIVVDDGSKDNSLEIMEKVAALDKRIIVIKTENHGQAVARQTALRSATGDYISFIDADDWVEPMFIQTLVAGIEAYKADISIVGYSMYYDDQRKYVSMSDNRVALNLEGDAIDFEWVTSNHFRGFLWDKLFKKEQLQMISFDQGYNFMEDVAIIDQLMPNIHKIRYVGMPLYYYRQHSQSTIRGGFQMEQSHILDVIQNMICRQTNDLNRNAAHYRYIVTILQLLARFKENDYITQKQLIVNWRDKMDTYYQNSRPFMNVVDRILVYLIIKTPLTRMIIKIRSALIKLKYFFK